MIGKLTKGAWALFIYVCVGTIISQMVILMYLVSAWKIDQPSMAADCFRRPRCQPGRGEGRRKLRRGGKSRRTALA